MIIITSEVVIAPEYWQEALELAKTHVVASRKEEGCISHRYLISPEVDHCIFFYEEWQNREAIDFHFSQSYSKAISKHFNQWATNDIQINFHHVKSQ
jgi:quinol monooxygenase YgiN